MDENDKYRHHELIRRQKLDTLATLSAVDRGTHWHPLNHETYRGISPFANSADDTPPHTASC